MTAVQAFRTSLVWKRPAALGEPEVLRGLGAVVSPLLAGFSLATAAALVTTDKPPPLGDVSVLALSLTTALLLFAMQFSAMALRYWVSPADRLSWNPEAKVDQNELELERQRQAVDVEKSRIYTTRTRHLYNLGLLAFLLGLSTVMVPHHWTPLREAGVAIAAAAGIVEAVWILGEIPRLGRLTVLVPLMALYRRLVVEVGPGDVHLSTLDETSIKAVMGK